MKKVIEMVVCCMLIVTLVGCKNAVTTNVKIDYGTSAIYTKEDMDSAIDTIKETFKSFEGCELYNLSYSSDDVCRDEENIAWMNDLERANDNKQIFTQCIMFDSSFRSPKKGDGAWEPNEEYTWSWWLARSEGCLLYPSDAADDLFGVRFGVGRLFEKKTNQARGLVQR